MSSKAELPKRVKEDVKRWQDGEELIDGDIANIIRFIDDRLGDSTTLGKSDKESFLDSLKNCSSSYRNYQEVLYNCILVELQDYGFKVLRGARINKVKGRFFDSIKESDKIGQYLQKSFDTVDIFTLVLRKLKLVKMGAPASLDLFGELLCHFTLNEAYIEKMPDFLFFINSAQIDWSTGRVNIKRKGRRLSIYIAAKSRLMLKAGFDRVQNDSGEDTFLFGHLFASDLEHKSKIPQDVWLEVSRWIAELSSTQIHVRTIRAFFANSYRMYKVFYRFSLEVTANMSGMKYGYIATDEISENAFLYGGTPEAIVEASEDLNERDIFQLLKTFEYDSLKNLFGDTLEASDNLISEFMKISTIKPKDAQKAKTALEFKGILDERCQELGCNNISFAADNLLYYLQEHSTNNVASSIKKYYTILKKLFFIKIAAIPLETFQQQEWEDLGLEMRMHYQADYRGKIVDFVRFLNSKGIVGDNEFDASQFYKNTNFALKKEKLIIQSIFGPDEIKKIFKSLIDKEDEQSLWLFCLGLCGLRAEECFLLEPRCITSIFRSNNKVREFNLRVINSKSRNGSYRGLPVHALLPPEVFTYFADLVDRRLRTVKSSKGPILLVPFCDDWDLINLSAQEKEQALNKVFSKVRKAVKLRGNLKFHTLRHYTITTLVVRLVEFITGEKIQVYSDENWLSVPRRTIKDFVGYQDDEVRLQILARRNLFGIALLIAGHGDSSTTAQVYMNLMPLIIRALNQDLSKSAINESMDITAMINTESLIYY
jgi:hypothetical protein